MFFWGIFNALLHSVSSTFWKKSLQLSLVPDRVFYGIGMAGSAVLALGIVALGKFEIAHLPWWIAAVPFLDAVAVFYASMLSQKIYKEEKVSALMPFEHLASVFTIVAAFFIFGDTPFGTLAIAIVVIAIIFTSSFDFANRHFPKKFGLIVANHGINAGRALAISYAFSETLSNATFYAARNLSSTVLAWVGIFAFSQLATIKVSSREFLSTRLAASFLGAISAFIGFALLAKFGLVTSTLLGFLSMVSTLAFSYFYLGDKPEKKNVILAALVASLVALGTYLKAAG